MLIIHKTFQILGKTEVILNCLNFCHKTGLGVDSDVLACLSYFVAKMGFKSNMKLTVREMYADIPLIQNESNMNTVSTYIKEV